MAEWTEITQESLTSFLARFESLDGAELRRVEINDGISMILTFDAYEPGLEPLPSHTSKVIENRWVELLVVVQGVTEFKLQQHVHHSMMQLNDRVVFLHFPLFTAVVLDPLRSTDLAEPSLQTIRNSEFYVIGQSVGFKVARRRDEL